MPRYQELLSPDCNCNGEKETGVSLMQIDREMDAGAVADMEVVSIEKDDDAFSVDKMVKLLFLF